MSVLDTVAFPAEWRRIRLGAIAPRVSEAGFGGLEPLSVFLGEGVVPRSSRDDNHNQLGADLEKYQRVLPGDLVFNKLRTWQGGFGVSAHTGIVSPAYIIARPRPEIVPRYLHHLMRSEPLLAELSRLSKWMPPSQFDIGWEDIRGLELALPPLDEQRRIADFLDDQVALLDSVVASTRVQSLSVEGWRVGRLTQVIFPAGVRRLPVRSFAEVRLGRQRSPERAEGPNMKPYLRSANVSDGAISLANVLEMDFSPGEQSVFALRPGDVLVTEGAGSPEAVGASAMWDGSASEMYFQNTLVRLRARPGRVMPTFLAWWARTSHLSGAMRVAAAGANILHLGADGLARMPIPALSVEEQARLASLAEEVDTSAARLAASLSGRVSLLEEYKRSLITAAVTGELDVTTARTGVPV